MRLLSVLLASFGLFAACKPQPSVESDAERSRQKDENKPLIVFFVHGYGGDASSFGEARQFLEEDFKGKVKTPLITYPNLSSTFDIMESYKVINAHIISYFVENKLPFDTPYSVVAHSLGGNSVLAYLLNCIEHRNRRCNYNEGVAAMKKGIPGMPDPKEVIETQKRDLETLQNHQSSKAAASTPTNIKQFFVIGAPLWGGYLMSRLRQLDIFKPFNTKIQQDKLNRLEAGSISLLLNRKMILEELNRKTNKWPKDFILNKINIYSIVADISELRDFKLQIAKLLNGLENDLTVEVPTARLEFTYYLEDKDHPGKAIEGITEFTKGTLPLKLPHMGIAGMEGINEVHSKNHPGFKYYSALIDSYFSGKPPRVALSEDDVIKSFESFSSQLVMRLPLGYSRPILTQDLLASDAIKIGPDSHFDTYKVKDYLLARTSGLEDPDRNTFNYETFFHAGILKDSYGVSAKNIMENKAKVYHLPYEIRIPGWKTKSFKTPVSPAYAAYSEVYLEPDTPYSGQLEKARLYNGRYVISALRKDRKKIVLFTAPVDGSSVRINTEEVDSASFPPRDNRELGEIVGNCFVGHVGIHHGEHKGEVFAEFEDEKAVRGYKMKEGDKIPVIGRHINKTKGVDRYLVVLPDARRFTKREKGDPKRDLAWVNTVDIDVIASEKCRAEVDD